MPHPDYSTLTVADFRAKVAGHLARAQRKIPHALPDDVFDPAITPMMDELQALDDFLFGFGYNERRQEDAEHAATKRGVAKRRDPALEERAMLVDQHIQSTMEALGVERGDFILLPMQADLLANAFVRFLDALPALAFAENRMIPQNFPASRDETVAGLIRLMRERKTLTRDAA